MHSRYFHTCQPAFTGPLAPSPSQQRQLHPAACELVGDHMIDQPPAHPESASAAAAHSSTVAKLPSAACLELSGQLLPSKSSATAGGGAGGDAGGGASAQLSAAYET